MAAFVMCAEPDQVASLGDPISGSRCELFWMPCVAHWLLDIVRRVVVEEGWLFAEELSVWIDGSWKRLCEPVQCDAVENLVYWRRLITPLLEFLANPC